MWLAHVVRTPSLVTTRIMTSSVRDILSAAVHEGRKLTDQKNSGDLRSPKGFGFPVIGRQRVGPLGIPRGLEVIM